VGCRALPPAERPRNSFLICERGFDGRDDISVRERGVDRCGKGGERIERRTFRRKGRGGGTSEKVKGEEAEYPKREKRDSMGGPSRERTMVIEEAGEVGLIRS